MKKLSTSIVFSLVSLYFFAQNYKLLPDSCTYCFYTNSSTGTGDYGAFYSVENTSYFSSNGNTYSYYIQGGVGPVFGDTLAYYRQLGDKVYGLPKDSIQEHLVMDFDVNIGDTISSLMSFEGNYDPWYYRAIVQDKDSLQLTDGSYHRFLHLNADSVHNADGFQGNWNDIVWQEKGLCYANNLPNIYASRGGLIYNFGPHTDLDQGWYLNPINCSTDTLIPSNFHNYGHTCDLCTPIANGINEKSKNIFKLYPNPANEITYIESELITNQIAIYDLTGKLFESNQNLSENEIDISHLNSGVYLLEVIFNNGVSQTQKLIISR